MWVHPAGRGKGAGDALTQAVAAWSRESGARTLRLTVMDNNPAAAALYERNGFRFTGVVDEVRPRRPPGAGHGQAAQPGSVRSSSSH
jgi:ribosomal protein S18 acetylase RimI-like enzyme